jgi:major membrane immunogen (membrane-anchored lipoprotein)
MKNTFTILIFFLLVNCSTSNAIVETVNPQFESMTFDAVTKNLIFEGDFPKHFTNLSNQWFDNKVKINGFEGNMTFILKNYSEQSSKINDGRKINISVEFQVLLEKSSLSQKKVIKGKVNSFSTLTGNFSLSEFDQLIIKTQTDLILRLSRNLKSKI